MCRRQDGIVLPAEEGIRAPLKARYFSGRRFGAIDCFPFVVALCGDDAAERPKADRNVGLSATYPDSCSCADVRQLTQTGYRINEVVAAARDLLET